MMKVKIACLLAGGSALGGCSLLYNPNNLPGAKADAAPDAPTIVDAGALGLDTAAPKVLFEGQGTGGSRPAILVVRGHDIAQDATVALVPVGAQGAAPMIQIDNEHAVRSLSGTAIAVPVTLPIDTSRGTSGTCDGPDNVALTVQVTQVAAGAPLMQEISGQLSLCNLPELESDKVIIDSTVLLPQYSQVSVLPGLSFTTGTQRVVIRAVGSIELGDVNADASGQQPGPGGATGGAKLAMGGGASGGKPGNVLLGGSGVLVSGSGGGFGLVGGEGKGTPNNPGGVVSGDELMVSSTANQSSGGGGGGKNPGGGGGGALELTAGGTLKTGNISANGANGGDGDLLSGAGGGGSGGAIVLRSGAAATLGAVTATGGAGGNINTTKSGGDGGGGRLRYDVPAFSEATPNPMMTAGTIRRGVAFSRSLDDVPLITHDPQQLLKVISDKTSDVFKVYVRDAVGTTTAMDTIMFDTTSVGITPILRVGYNRVCVTPPLGDPDIVESTNCIDIAYVR